MLSQNRSLIRTCRHGREKRQATWPQPVKNSKSIHCVNLKLTLAANLDGQCACAVNIVTLCSVYNSALPTCAETFSSSAEYIIIAETRRDVTAKHVTRHLFLLRGVPRLTPFARQACLLISADNDKPPVDIRR